MGRPAVEGSLAHQGEEEEQVDQVSNSMRKIPMIFSSEAPLSLA